MNYGTVSFHNARASGTEIYQLSSGQADHVCFYGTGGVTSAIEIGSYNDTTTIGDDNGATLTYLGAESGKLTNCKYASDSTITVSGHPIVNIADLNSFNVANLTTYPDFWNRPSGTLMILYCSSGTSTVRTYNAKLFAYEAGGALTTVPPDVTVKACEINASGNTYSSTYSGVWTSIHGLNSALLFADHSSANGWEPHDEHIWVAAISTKADSVGVLDSWNFCFQMQYA